MAFEPSRRSFLAAAAALPAATALPAAAVPAEVNKVSYRVLGKTGLKVTAVGFGSMITSDPSVIARALEMGITYFDTARGYQHGNNERMVGAALKSRRKDIVLSSKSEAKTAAEATAELETSLKEIGTDYLDIWYIHSKDKPAQVPDELVEAWVKAKQQGKIRHIGLSTHSPNDMVDRILEIGKIEVVLSTYNFTMGETRDATFERISKAGLGLVAMKVMAGGLRTQNPQPQMQRPMAGLAALKWAIRKPYYRPTGDELPGHDGHFGADRGAHPGGAAGTDPAGLLPHVLWLRRAVHEGLAGDRHAALCRLCRRLRPIRAGARALSQIAGSHSEREVRRLHIVCGSMPQRCGCGAPVAAGAGTVRLTFRDRLRSGVHPVPLGVRVSEGAARSTIFCRSRAEYRKPAATLPK
jgi:diketogulonate reductase-like aldo/keto reductase